MPTFLGNHANSGIILHYAWSGQVRYGRCKLFEYENQVENMSNFKLYYKTHPVLYLRIELSHMSGKVLVHLWNL